MQWRKVAAATMAVALSASLLAGCGSTKTDTKSTDAAKPAEKVTLQFWAHWSSEQRRPTIDKIIKTWNDAHPDIQVVYTPVPFDQIITKTLAGVAAQNPPDVVVIDAFTTQQRASKKQVTDLSQFGADSLKDQYFAGPFSGTQYNGKTYALPFVTDTRLLFYNKAAFKEVGLDPNNPPKTWDDLSKYADKLDKKNGDKLVRVGFHPLQGGGLDLWDQNAKANFWNADKTQPTINSAENIKVLDWIKGWNDRYGQAAWQAFKGTFQGGANDPFITGQVAMEVNVGTFAAQIKKYKPDMEYGMVAIPTPDGQQHNRASYSGGFSIEVPAGVKNAKQAYEFAKYLSTQAVSTWATEQIDMPAFKAAAAGINDPTFKAMADNMANTSFELRPLGAPDWGSALNKAQDDVMAGKATSKAALDQAQADVLKMLQDNKGK
ncbi:MAG: ABC transporter substrate-binding protein [Mycobacterium leprae]